MHKILVLNLGSTSTKVALYEDLTCTKTTTLRHDAKALEPFKRVLDQVNFRKDLVEAWCSHENINLKDLSVFCVRGALVKPIEGGIYKINETMIQELKDEKYGSHVSNVGMILGDLWAHQFNKEAIFVNAPVTDELCDLARYTGIKGIQRRSIFHALNQKQIALEYAKSTSQPYETLNLVVCHMGGGITVGAHHQGRIIDVNNAIDGEGPMTPERAGAMSALNAVELYETLNRDLSHFKKALAGQGGLMSHLGSNDVKGLLEKAQSDPRTQEVIDAMVYQINKEIGAMAVVAGFPLSAILITGGMAYAPSLVEAIKDKVHWLAPVVVYPGEDELDALAAGALRYLLGEEKLKFYD